MEGKVISRTECGQQELIGGETSGNIYSSEDVCRDIADCSHNKFKSIIVESLKRRRLVDSVGGYLKEIRENRRAGDEE
jgi:hypothetical protein